MIFPPFQYATPSAFKSTRDSARLGLAVDPRRPVRFHGRVVRTVPLLRFALRALGEVIWSRDAHRRSIVLRDRGRSPHRHDEHRLTQGPCAHLIALLETSESPTRINSRGWVCPSGRRSATWPTPTASRSACCSTSHHIGRTNVASTTSRSRSRSGREDRV